MADSKTESKTKKPAKRHECPKCHGTRFHRNTFGVFDDKGQFEVDEVAYRCIFCHELVHEDELVVKDVL